MRSKSSRSSFHKKSDSLNKFSALPVDFFSSFAKANPLSYKIKTSKFKGRGLLETPNSLTHRSTPYETTQHPSPSAKLSILQGAGKSSKKILGSTNDNYTQRMQITQDIIRNASKLQKENKSIYLKNSFNYFSNKIHKSKANIHRNLGNEVSFQIKEKEKASSEYLPVRQVIQAFTKSKILTNNSKHKFAMGCCKSKLTQDEDLSIEISQVYSSSFKDISIISSEQCLPASSFQNTRIECAFLPNHSVKYTMTTEELTGIYVPDDAGRSVYPSASYFM